MPLDVLGDMREQADHSGREPLPADLARLCQRRRIERAHHGFGIFERRIQAGKQFFPRRARFEFRLVRGPLSFGKLPPLDVSHQAAGAAGDVPQMKSHRAESVRREPRSVRA